MRFHDLRKSAASMLSAMGFLNPEDHGDPRPQDDADNGRGLRTSLASQPRGRRNPGQALHQAGLARPGRKGRPRRPRRFPIANAAVLAKLTPLLSANPADAQYRDKRP